MTFAWEFPYASRRSPIMAANAVATSQPLAAQAGLEILQRGGNAIDAAVATAIALTVVEPVSNGIGSDAFALVWDGKELHGLNASGKSPTAWSLERFKSAGCVPTRGWESVTVPGAVSAWVALAQRFGQLPFEALFEPALRYARDGYLVSPVISEQWHAAVPELREFPGYAQAFMPRGRAPLAGELFRFPDQAATLEEIARTHGEAFYRGALAERIAASAREHGAALTVEDLNGHTAEWVMPLRQRYRDQTIAELPPNGQGIAALMALGILDHFELSKYACDSVDSWHLQIEAMKHAFAEVYAHVADPANMTRSPEELLDPEFLRILASSISLTSASQPKAQLPRNSGTVYLCAADAAGRMVSYIQSNYMGFGSGVVVPGTGISLQNRGAGFGVDPLHPNCVDGGKRPFHTIIPGFVLDDQGAVASLGVMGGNMQPQGHLQMVVRMRDYRQNPQTAADAPRWKINEDMSVSMETEVDPRLVEDLAARGHVIVPPQKGYFEFGSAQIIHRVPGGYIAASDPRRDGQAVGF
ncbi:gamma-glutamyltransferase family protein [Methylibium sp.]|uniref:gamma-glutamyltransferase family protein n=1 Tax=Methylibium sp. TaxID=2067992 RepID=UPI0018478FBD|nr:gamma-glutamyltransferase family protein [Methylibium sp.]MBA3590071.1 gamma-glutamyltransferase family protein [Methylibium sp.]